MSLLEITEANFSETLLWSIANNRLTDEFNEKITHLHFNLNAYELMPFKQLCTALETNKNITSLSISGFYLTNQQALALNKLLSQTTAISELCLKSVYNQNLNLISIEDIIDEVFCQNTSLRILTIDWLYLSQSGMARITEFLSRNQQLEQLSLKNIYRKRNGDELSFIHFIDFGKAVKSHSSLQSLKFSDLYGGFGPDMLTVLADALLENKVLKKLKLRNIDINTPKMVEEERNHFFNHLNLAVKNKRRASHGLPKKENLAILCLSAFSNALSVNSTLEELDFSRNTIQSSVFSIFLTSLIKNHGLRTLNLSRCGTGLSDNKILLANLIEKNTGLEALILNSCYLGGLRTSKNEFSTFIAVMHNNKNLRSIQLEHNNFSKAQINLIASIFDKNKTLEHVLINEPHLQEEVNSTLALIEKKSAENVERNKAERRMVLFHFARNCLKNNDSQVQEPTKLDKILRKPLNLIAEFANCERKPASPEEEIKAKSNFCTLM